MREIRKIALMAVGDAGWQGGIQYIINILNALNKVTSNHHLEVHLFKNSSQNFFNLERFRNIRLVVSDIETVLEPWTLFNRVKWFFQRKFFKRVYPRLENHLILNHFDYVFPASISDCNSRLNVGSWIADFQYHHFPEGASSKVTTQARNTISEIVQNARKIILSSRYCEKDCLNLFPSSAGKTHVMPFAVALDTSVVELSEFEKIRLMYQLPSRFLMVANLFAPTKNHKTIFKALGILNGCGIKIDLVCTGNIVDYRNDSFANEILETLTQEKVRSQVHLLGLIPREHQLVMYRMAIGLVQPSINEGWSTLVEEAKALGKNLLMSDIDVHLEQRKGNPYQFAALNAKDLADKINELWQMESENAFPKMEEEQSALEHYQEQVKDFGRRFLEIASIQN